MALSEGEKPSYTVCCFSRSTSISGLPPTRISISCHVNSVSMRSGTMWPSPRLMAAMCASNSWSLNHSTASQYCTRLLKVTGMVRPPGSSSTSSPLLFAVTNMSPGNASAKETW
jgi:hypothetical protein